MDGFPERYDIINPFKRLKELASKIGHISGRPQASVIYLSEHYRPEPSDGEALPMPLDKARLAAHYILMAEEAKYENRG